MSSFPESGILLRRPAGKLSPAFHLSPGMIPLPLVYAVYLGIAEAAYDTALATARKRPGDHGLPSLVGEMHNDLALARMAHRDMVEAADTGEPGLETTNHIWTGRALVGGAACVSWKRPWRSRVPVRFTGLPHSSGCSATFRARGTIDRSSESSSVSADGWS